MARRIFISFNHKDKDKAQGFNLLQWNKNVDLEFVGRHLISPVESNDASYISTKIKEELKGTSATVVLIGRHSSESDWQEKEIQWSLEKGNGIIGIKLDKNVQTPEILKDCGAEILDWDVSKFANAIERAVSGTRRNEQINQAQGLDVSCRR